MNFNLGPLISIASLWIGGSFLGLGKLKSDVSKVAPRTSNASELIPFMTGSIYATHRRLYPKSGMRKLFGSVVICGAFVTLMFGVFLVLGV